MEVYAHAHAMGYRVHDYIIVERGYGKEQEGEEEEWSWGSHHDDTCSMLRTVARYTSQPRKHATARRHIISSNTAKKTTTTSKQILVQPHKLDQPRKTTLSDIGRTPSEYH